MTKLFILPLLFSAACALETPAEPETSSADQDLTSQEVESTWFSDAAYTNAVGETDLYCSGGKYQHGTINTRFVERFYSPCNGAGGTVVKCFELVIQGQYNEVPCPGYLF